MVTAAPSRSLGEGGSPLPPFLCVSPPRSLHLHWIRWSAMTYIHEVFLPQTLEAAKHVALTSAPQDPQKFERETQFLVDFLRAQGLVSADTRVLDFGCGMGRVAKALIQQNGCSEEGTDVSPAMRHFAEGDVASPKVRGSQEVNQKL